MNSTNTTTRPTTTTNNNNNNTCAPSQVSPRRLQTHKEKKPTQNKLLYMKKKKTIEYEESEYRKFGSSLQKMGGQYRSG